MNHEKHDVPPANPGHETSDVNLRGIFAFAAALTVSMIAVNVGTYLLFGAFERHAARLDPPRPPLVDERRPPAGPRLQVSAAADAAELRERERRDLNRLRWIDERQRVVQIPIERAMEIVAERGPPAWPEVKEPVGESAGGADAGENDESEFDADRPGGAP